MSNIILVFVEVILVIALSRLVGWGCRWLNQPLVIGEIVAGILLGPSFLGWLAPAWSAMLFPPQTMPFLNLLSQLGLVFFMFLIGLELDPKYIKGRLDLAVLTSTGSSLLPFLLAIGLSFLLYPLLSDSSVSFAAFTIFLGAALSITAFPVLARIITENNLQGTSLGTLALASAAVNDLTGWGLLAVAISITTVNSVTGAIPTLGLSVLFIILMVGLVRPFLRRFATYYDRIGHLSQTLLAATYIIVLTSALVTEKIGIHLIFGAFLVGAIIPKHPGLVQELAQKTEDFALVVLLPVFFAYSGLQTQLGLLDQPKLWGLAALIVAAAIVGKVGGVYGSARLGGLPHHQAIALGCLMNTRGLTELIILNIGLSLKVISPTLFTMMVVMALVTTLITSPLLSWVSPPGPPAPPPPEVPVAALITPVAYRILVPVANPTTQRELVQLATTIAGAGQQAVAVYPLALVELEEEYSFARAPLEANRRIAEEQKRLEALIASLGSQQIHPLVCVARDVAHDINRIAMQETIDLVVLGWHRPTFSKNRLGGRVGQILSTVRTDVAVYLPQPGPKEESFQQILVPYWASTHNDLALELALRLLLNHPTMELTILRFAGEKLETREFSPEVEAFLSQLAPQIYGRLSLPIVETNHPQAVLIEASQKADLTLAGVSRRWGAERQNLGRSADILANCCQSALLITRRYHQIPSHLTQLVHQV